MEFLKEILGDELYNQVETAINAHNGNDANAEKQVKLANLKTGDYVGKGKYDNLNAQLMNRVAELESANGLIEDFKKSSKGNDDLQSKIGDYENAVVKLQEELADTKLKAAVKVALLSEKASDIDYLTFKLEQKLKDENKILELDENDNVKDFKDVLTGLKIQFPNQFESSNVKKIEEHKLEESDENRSFTKNDILNKPYAERLKFKQENPDAYSEAMKN